MKELFLKASLAFSNASFGSLAGWSDEQKKFYSSGSRSPQCSERLLDNLGNISIKFLSSKREKVSFWKYPMFTAKYAERPKCNFLWNVKGNEPLDVQKRVEILNVVETDRIEESIGSDERTIDNSMSSSGLKRKFSVSKQWTKTYSIEYEKITK